MSSFPLVEFRSSAVQLPKPIPILILPSSPNSPLLLEYQPNSGIHEPGVPPHLRFPSVLMTQDVFVPFPVLLLSYMSSLHSFPATISSHRLSESYDPLVPVPHDHRYIASRSRGGWVRAWVAVVKPNGRIFAMLSILPPIIYHDSRPESNHVSFQVEHRYLQRPSSTFPGPGREPALHVAFC